MTTRDDILERLSLAASYPWGPIRSSLTAETLKKTLILSLIPNEAEDSFWHCFLVSKGELPS